MIVPFLYEGILVILCEYAKVHVNFSKKKYISTLEMWWLGKCISRLHLKILLEFGVRLHFGLLKVVGYFNITPIPLQNAIT